MKVRTGPLIASVILISLCSAALVVVGQSPPQTPVQPPAQTPPQNPPTTPANPDAATNPDDQKYKLAVDVELVNVVATVLDENQKYMDGLKKEDFKVFEDGQEQAISFFSHDLR